MDKYVDNSPEDETAKDLFFNLDITQLISTYHTSSSSVSGTLNQLRDDMQNPLNSYKKDRIGAEKCDLNLIFKGTAFYVVFRDPSDDSRSVTGILTCHHVVQDLHGANPVLVNQNLDQSKEKVLSASLGVFSKAKQNGHNSELDVLRDTNLDYAFFPTEIPAGQQYFEVKRGAEKGSPIGIFIIFKEVEHELYRSDGGGKAKIDEISRNTTKGKMIHRILSEFGLSGSPVVSRDLSRTGKRGPKELVALHTGEFYPYGALVDCNKYIGHATMAEAIERDVFNKLNRNFISSCEIKTNIARNDGLGPIQLMMVCAGTDLLERVQLMEHKQTMMLTSQSEHSEYMQSLNDKLCKVLEILQPQGTSGMTNRSSPEATVVSNIPEPDVYRYMISDSSFEEAERFMTMQGSQEVDSSHFMLVEGVEQTGNDENIWSQNVAHVPRADAEPVSLRHRTLCKSKSTESIASAVSEILLRGGDSLDSKQPVALKDSDHVENSNSTFSDPKKMKAIFSQLSFEQRQNIFNVFMFLFLMYICIQITFLNQKL